MMVLVGAYLNPRTARMQPNLPGSTPLCRALHPLATTWLSELH